MKTAHDIEKSVRIVVTSGLVNQERFSKGLRESLEPRLRAVGPLPMVYNCKLCSDSRGIGILQQ